MLSIVYVYIYFTICFLIAILLLIALSLAFKVNGDANNSSSFECGFDVQSTSRLPFSINFFMVAVIFLVFDVEVALLLPFLISAQSLVLFLLVLLVGTFYEWGYGGLTWLV